MFCSKCGKEAQDGQKFCADCGHGIEAPPSAETFRIRKYRCPSCGSYHIRVYAQMMDSNGKLTQIASKTGAGYSAAGYETMWQCKDCGFRFQDPNEKRKHLRDSQTAINLFLGCFGCAIAGIFAFITGPIGIVIGAIFALGTIAANNSITHKKLKAVDDFEQTILTHQ